MTRFVEFQTLSNYYYYYTLQAASVYNKIQSTLDTKKYTKILNKSY